MDVEVFLRGLFHVLKEFMVRKLYANPSIELSKN